MSLRRIPRREVLAFIALNGGEESMPSGVEFREYVYSGEEWHVIGLAVETEQAVRFWAGVFGHKASHFRTSDHVRQDGTRWVKYASQDKWRGFITEVSASVDLDVPAGDELDDETRQKLGEIAGGAG